MQTKANTTSQYLKPLTILCYAFTFGVSLFTIISLVLTLTGVFPSSLSDMAPIFDIIVAVLAVTGIFAGNTLFNTRMLVLKDMQSLGDKLNGYRAAIILRYALLEGPGLFSIIAYLLTGDKKLLIVTACAIILMIYRVPKKETLIKDLELSFEEANIINDPDGAIG